MYNPAHPGEVLQDVLANMTITVTEFAAHIGISRNSLSRILNGRAGVTPDVSIRLAQAFGQSDLDVWFKMQAAHDFWRVSRSPRAKVPKLRKAA